MSEIIERARLAAHAEFGIRSETSLSVAVGDAEHGAEAYARVVLEYLRDEFTRNCEFQRKATNAERAYGWEDATTEVQTLLRQIDLDVPLRRNDHAE